MAFCFVVDFSLLVKSFAKFCFLYLADVNENPSQLEGIKRHEWDAIHRKVNEESESKFMVNFRRVTDVDVLMLRIPKR